MPKADKVNYELTDAEKRDLIQLIQQNKNLPEKYRFVLFEDKREVELVWNGKTREVCTTILPFQSLEHIDEPRREAPEIQGDLFDSRGRQLKGWTNKLIWGDNKLILSSLKAGALRQQIEEVGGLKLIYIDPPFDVGANFSMDMEIGGETFHKEPNLRCHSRENGNPETSTLDSGSPAGMTRQERQRHVLAQKEREFRDLILRAYKATPLTGASAQAQDEFFHGHQAGRLVVIGPINLPVGRLFVEEVITECRKRGASRVDVLAFEFEMGLFPAVLDEARAKGIDLTPRYIPAEVFDKRAVDKGQVVFHDVSFIEATPRYDNKDKLMLRIELTDFSVYYTQGAVEAAIASLKNGKSEVVCEQGRLMKISKDKDGVVTRTELTKHWTDWVDYWAVDFDYMSRKEIIKVPNSMDLGLNEAPPPQPVRPSRLHALGRSAARSSASRIPASPPASGGGSAMVEFEERWTGGYIFENEWQAFRTRRNRDLELISAAHVYSKPGRYTVAVKVIDIFGNDTMTLVPVNVG